MRRGSFWRKADDILAGLLGEHVEMGVLKTGAQFSFEEIVGIRSELLVPPNVPTD